MKGAYLNYIENTKLTYIVLIFAAFCTILIRILPLIIKLPQNNKRLNRFFNVVPYTALTVLVFPDIFTSTGTSMTNILLVIFAMIIIAIYSIRKTLKNKGENNGNRNNKR